MSRCNWQFPHWGKIQNSRRRGEEEKVRGRWRIWSFKNHGCSNLSWRYWFFFSYFITYKFSTLNGFFGFNSFYTLNISLTDVKIRLIVFFCYWKAYFWKNHQINFYLWSIHIWCQMFFWMFLTYVRTYPNPDTLLHMWMLGGRTHRTNSPLWKIAKMALLNPCLQCEFFKAKWLYLKCYGNWKCHLLILFKIFHKFRPCAYLRKYWG